MARKKGPKRAELAQIRKTAGFTQERFAEKLGVDYTTPSRWETGESDRAMRRPVVSPVQPGGIGGIFLGLMTYPEPKGTPGTRACQESDSHAQA